MHKTLWAVGSKVYFYVGGGSVDYCIHYGYITQSTMVEPKVNLPKASEEQQKDVSYNYEVMSQLTKVAYNKIPIHTKLFTTYEDCQNAITDLQDVAIQNLMEQITRRKENMNNIMKDN